MPSTISIARTLSKEVLGVTSSVVDGAERFDGNRLRIQYTAVVHLSRHSPVNFFHSVTNGAGAIFRCIQALTAIRFHNVRALAFVIHLLEKLKLIIITKQTELLFEKLLFYFILTNMISTTFFPFHFPPKPFQNQG